MSRVTLWCRVCRPDGRPQAARGGCAVQYRPDCPKPEFVITRDIWIPTG